MSVYLSLLCLSVCLPVCLCLCLPVSVCLHLIVRLCLSLGLSVAKVPKAVASWRAHCDQNGITVKSCAKSGPFTYEKQYEKHVLEHFKEFETWVVYDAAKSVVMQLQDHGTLEEFLLMIESRGEFNRIGFDNKWCIQHAHDIKLVVTNFKNSIDKDILKFVLLEALFFTVPLSPNMDLQSTAPQYPWFFNQKPPCQRIAGLEAPMGTSMVYNKKRKGMESPGKTPGKKAVKRGAACGVPSVLEKAEEEKMDSTMEDLQTDGQTTYRQETDRQTRDRARERERDGERERERERERQRQTRRDRQVGSLWQSGRHTDFCQDGLPKLWLHDVVQCITSPTAAIMQTQPSTYLPAVQASARHAIREALTFLFYGELFHNGKATKCWSQVRKAIKGTIIIEHTRVLRMDDQDRQTSRYTHTRNKHTHTPTHRPTTCIRTHVSEFEYKMIGKQVDKHTDQPHMQGPLHGKQVGGWRHWMA